MTVEQIPSDELVEMTELFHRAFNAGGCDPMCHCCFKMIKIGDNFKLATVTEVTPPKAMWGKKPKWNDPVSTPYVEERLEIVNGDMSSLDNRIGIKENINIETKEVMLCDTCTVKEFNVRQKKYAELQLEEKEEMIRRRGGGGCFRVNGKIIH